VDDLSPAQDNLVEGNYIGLNAAGTAALPGSGLTGIAILEIDNSSNNTIGGTVSSARNVISGGRTMSSCVPEAVPSGMETTWWKGITSVRMPPVVQPLIPMRLLYLFSITTSKPG
jgi:hypothetical protein